MYFSVGASANGPPCLDAAIFQCWIRKQRRVERAGVRRKSVGEGWEGESG